MTDLMMTLFEYASHTHLPDYLHDPEFLAASRRFDETESALNALLDDNGKHLLTQLINEYGSQAAFETYAFFEAAFGVCGELNRFFRAN